MKKLVFLCVLTLVFISCASKPKVESQNPAEVDLIEVEDDAKDNAENIQAEQNDSSEPEKKIAEDLNSDAEKEFDNEENSLEQLISEKIEVDDLQPLPEVEEIVRESEPDYKNDLLENEPLVKEVEIYSPENKNSQNEHNVSIDEKSVAKNSLEQTASNESKDENKSENSQENENSENSFIDIDENDEFNLVEDGQESIGFVDVSKIKPSRKMSVNKNQLIEIEYPGKGWIYQENINSEGEIDSRNKNFIFGGRKLGGENQSFTLRARTPGKFFLHFFKNDMLTGSYIDDYLEVNVENGNPSSEKIKAPSYAQSVPPKATITAQTVKEKKQAQKQRQEEKNILPKEEMISSKDNAKNESSSKIQSNENQIAKEESNIKTVVQTANDSEKQKNAPQNQDQIQQSAQSFQNQVASNTQNKDKNQSSEQMADLQNKTSENSVENPFENLSSEDLLEKAKFLYNEKDYSNAYNYINKFFEKGVKRIDEGFFVKGQILEARSDVQNIKDAIASYEMVVKNYPTSKFWDDANKRIIYLKRFYINIR